MKRKMILLLALLLIAVMCMTLASCSRPHDYLEIGRFQDGTYAVMGVKESERENIESITIPDSVIIINQSAFKGCTALTSITIPDSVTSISYYAFSGCTALTSITIPDSVTSIESWAFEDCTGLTSITIPDSVTRIGERAFEGCTDLTSVYYTGTAEEWSQIAIYYYNDKLTDATRYYYSETQPTAEGNYWHYVDGTPTPW